MYKNILKEKQNRAITRISLYLCGLKALDKQSKKILHFKRYFKICCFRDTQKAKNFKKTDASFWGLGVFFGGGVGYSLFIIN